MRKTMFYVSKVGRPTMPMVEIFLQHLAVTAATRMVATPIARLVFSWKKDEG